MFTVTTLTGEPKGESRQPPASTTQSASGEANNPYADDFFGKRASLTVSGQLEGEIYASAVGPIYTFGPTFRRRKPNTARHLAEFLMIEPEVSLRAARQHAARRRLHQVDRPGSRSIAAATICSSSTTASTTPYSPPPKVC
ncbi:MAG: amino acid--tRNA ligase-related protein [Planctomycetaceae bacterium]